MRANNELQLYAKWRQHACNIAMDNGLDPQCQARKLER
jgi:hypothetical protein